MTLDDIRARLPLCGFAVFAMDPAEGVTLEVYEPGGQTFQWRGPSVADVLAQAFPSVGQADATVSSVAVEQVSAAPAGPPSSVFD